MSIEELVMSALRLGAVFGIGIGIVAALVGKEVYDAYREYRQALEHERQIRCMKDWK